MLRDFVARWSAFATQARQCVAQRDWVRIHRDAHSLKGVCGTLGAEQLRDLAEGLEHAAGRMQAAVAGQQHSPGGNPDSGHEEAGEQVPARQGHDDTRETVQTRAGRAVTDALDPLEAELSRLVAGLRDAFGGAGDQILRAGVRAGETGSIDDGQDDERIRAGGAIGDRRPGEPTVSDPAGSLDAAQLARALDLARRALTLLESSELVVVQYIEAERGVFRAWMGRDRFRELDDALRDYDLERAAAVLAAAAQSLVVQPD
jgi:HPt (histidine-containing phosphotransfer) domain-containing protein